MFPTRDKRRKGSITVHRALRHTAALARAFILLEDPDLSSPRTPGDGTAHPHRVPLQLRRSSRRPGAGLPRPERCTTPTGAIPRAVAASRTSERTATNRA